MITGSLVALVTPMHADGQIDWGCLHNLIEYHIDQGTDGLVIAGTTGESATLTVTEHCELIRRAVDQVAGRLPIIAGTGANATREAIHLTEAAKKLGVDACLLVTPYYNKPTQEGLYCHYKAVAEAVSIPQILYNVPSRTGVDLLPETVSRLALLTSVIGLKEATGSISRSREVQALCGDSFALYSGDDETGMEFMLNGGHGVISVTSNVAPRLMHKLCSASLKGDKESAVEINNQLIALHQALFLESNPIPVKWALQDMGLIKEGLRLPLTVLSESCQPTLRKVLAQLDLV